MEGKEWQNGVFTYGLLNGLYNRDADLNKDGKIMLSELNQYLIRKVPELIKLPEFLMDPNISTVELLMIVPKFCHQNI